MTRLTDERLRTIADGTDTHSMGCDLATLDHTAMARELIERRAAVNNPDYKSYTDVVYGNGWLDYFIAWANEGRGANRRCVVCGHKAANHSKHEQGCLASRPGVGARFVDARGITRIAPDGTHWCPCDLSCAEVKIQP